MKIYKIVVCVIAITLVTTGSLFAAKTDYLGGYFGVGISSVNITIEEENFSSTNPAFSLQGWAPFSPDSPFGYSVSGDITGIEGEPCLFLNFDVGFNFPQGELYAFYFGAGAGYLDIYINPDEEIAIPYLQATGSMYWQFGKTSAMGLGFNVGGGSFQMTGLRFSFGTAF